MSTNKGDLKKLWAGIAQAFKDFKGEPQKFGSSKLADGSTTLQWEGEEPMPGMAVMAVGPDGSSAPCPDGEYVLPETGTTIKVEGGVITTAVPAQAQEEGANPAANQGMSDDAISKQAKEIVERVEKVSKFMETAEARFASMEKLISDQAEVIATQKKENDALNEKVLKFTEQVTKTIEEYGEQPQEQGEKEQNFRNEEKPKESLEEFRKRTFNR